MTLHTTGSSEILSSMNFMKNGSFTIKNYDVNLSKEDAALLSMTQQFFLYALERDDWLMHYLSDVNDTLVEKEILSKKPHLTILQGGLSKE